ncbi:helix-turn-helix transcriptional regulator [Pseudokineococcus sp. 1T1Z-3]|uniref:helix-turn-helix transcriptional regulator n=1 Tax=Pseudokineococcus sp. 1T1Z-3 TaxID=3132745 RepID=UPI0030A81778
MQSQVRPGEGEAVTTRERVLAVVTEHGPATAGAVADVLRLTAAGVRRHLEAMEAEGLVRAQPATTTQGRGPGRPAREFVAAPRASRADDGYADLALDLLQHLAATGGAEAVRAYADHRAASLRERYAAEVGAAGDDVEARAGALAEALRRDGFAASTRPVDPGTGVRALQLCQGRCPVHGAAQAFPQLCDAETAAFSDLLGVGTRRLATLGSGDRVCTTHVPTAVRPRSDRSPADRTPADRAPADQSAPGRSAEGRPARGRPPASRRHAPAPTTPTTPEGPR